MNDEKAQVATCERCAGTGSVYNRVALEDFRCSQCGGQGCYPVSGYHCFYKRGDNPKIAIAIEQPDGRWRVSYFGKNGPWSHTIEKPQNAFGELYGYKMTPAAGRLLDQWSTTLEWEQGLKQLQWRMLYQMLSPHQECRDQFLPLLEGKASLDLLIKRAIELKKIYAPLEKIW